MFLMALTVLLSTNNGCNMTQETKVFTEYLPVPRSTMYNEDMVDSLEASQLVNNALLMYAQTKRNHGSRQSWYETDSNYHEQVIDITAGRGRVILSLPLNGLVTGAGRNVRAVVRLKTNAANSTNLYMKIGRNSGKTESVESTSYHWVTVDCPIDPIKGVRLQTPLKLVLYAAAVDTDTTLTVYSISVYETEANNVPEFTDLSGADNKIGVVDYPMSTAQQKLINDNLGAIYGVRMPRSNVFNHSSIDNTPSVTGSYSEVGRWVVHKAKGPTDMELKMFCTSFGSGGTATWKVEVYILGGGLYSTQTFDQLVASGLEWVELTLATIYDEEKEFEIVISALEKTSSVVAVGLFLLWIGEVLEGAGEVTHTLPSKKNTQTDDDVLASNWANIKTTMQQTWERNRQVLLNDYFMDYNAILSRYSNNLPINIGYLFPTYGSKKLHCRCRFTKPTKKGTYQLDYDGQSSNWVYNKGNDPTKSVVVGSTSGATGQIEYDYDAGTTGTLYLTGVVGNFLDNEAITCSTGGAALVNGTQENLVDVKILLKFGIYESAWVTDFGTITPSASHTIDVSDYEEEKGFDIDFVVPIPEEYWNEDDVLTSPLLLAIESTCRIPNVTDDVWKPVDYVKIQYLKVFEEVEGYL